MEADDRYVTLVLFAWRFAGRLRSSSRARAVQVEMRCRGDWRSRAAVQTKVSIAFGRYVSLVMARRWLVFGVCKGKRIRAVSPDREGEARS